MRDRVGLGVGAFGGGQAEYFRNVHREHLNCEDAPHVAHGAFPARIGASRVCVGVTPWCPLALGSRPRLAVLPTLASVRPGFLRHVVQRRTHGGRPLRRVRKLGVTAWLEVHGGSGGDDLTGKNNNLGEEKTSSRFGKVKSAK